MPETSNAAFKSRLLARAPLLGAFFKTPHPILVEVLARTGLDFLVIDAEHAPFDRAGIDLTEGTRWVAERVGGGDAESPIVLTRVLVAHRRYASRFFQVAPTFDDVFQAHLDRFAAELRPRGEIADRK